MTDDLIRSLERAVEADPASVALRVHLAELLVAAGRLPEAFVHASEALRLDPASDAARAVTLAALQPPEAATDPHPVSAVPDGEDDLSALEEQLADLAQPMFVSESGTARPETFDVESSTVTLADVGGMEQVKERLQSAFLAPLTNPELRRLYAKNLSGGLLMYGPPGCGKTFIARAVAGELGAKFIPIGITDILSPMFGASEANIHAAFELARREAPCVLFFDEIDALGVRRSQTSTSMMRNVVNQLLAEFDGVEGGTDGVFVLAATNQPWDLDPALRRPGRFDRTVLVLPPDLPARETILRSQLAHRPIEGIDVAALAARTEGYSGADLAYVCEVASEKALLDSVRSGTVRMIQQSDLLAALDEVRPSTTAWLESIRNIVMFGVDDGTHAELKAYLKSAKRR